MIECETTFDLSCSDFQTPASKPVLIKLVGRTGEYTAGSEKVICLAVPYFTNTTKILLSGRGGDWSLHWRSNYAIVFKNDLKLPIDTRIFLHTQSFKQ